MQRSKTLWSLLSTLMSSSSSASGRLSWTTSSRVALSFQVSDTISMISKFDVTPQVEEAYGTFKAEPASEDGWPTEWRFDMPEDDSISPEEAFDILFGYAEERHRNDPCARPAPKKN